MYKSWDPRFINNVAACFRLMSLLEIQKEEQEKGCLMVLANPSDLSHGKNYHCY